MDNTLRAILSELLSVSLELDRLRKRVAELEQEAAERAAPTELRQTRERIS